MTYSKLGTDTKTGERVDIFKLSRLLGLYIIGLQGMGKSGLIEELIVQDIKQEIGVCVLDPHGELVDNIIAKLPDEKKEEKVIYLDLAEQQYFFGLNLFACPDPTSDDEITKTVSQVAHVFEKAFGVSMSDTPRIYDYLFNSAYSLIANPGYTLLDIPLVFTDTSRQLLLARVPSAEVLRFWDDVSQLPKPDQSREERDVLRRLNDLSHAPLRFIVGQSHSTIDLRKIMDEGKILLVKLDRQREQATSLIGSIIVAQILNAANTRQTNKLFNLYADEFQNFATEDFAILLEQARKRGIGVTMAHQNRAQLELSDRQADKNLKARTLNVGNLVVFRVPTDAEELAKQFRATPKPPDIIGQEPIREPMQDVGRYLLTHRHPNKVVNDFVDTYLRPFAPALGEPMKTGTYDRFTQQCEFLRQSIATGDATLPVPGFLYYVAWNPNEVSAWFSDFVLPLFHYYQKLFDRHVLFLYIKTLLSAPDGKADNLLKEKNISKWEMCWDWVGKWRFDTLGQDYVWSALYLLDNGMQETIAKTVLEGLNKLETYVVSLRQVLKALLAEPIMTETGRFNPKPGPEETIANAQARLANELGRLPKFTAQVKLSDGNGNPDEHTIQTFAPGKGLYGQALRERVERIRQRNIRDGYLKDRAAIGEDITQRREALAQSLQVQQSKPALTPQAQRKVLLCSSCGASNQTGALFCNQCGTRL